MQNDAAGLDRQDQDLQFVLSHIPHTVVGREIKQFTKAEYGSYFSAYVEENRAIFQRLQQFCDRHTQQRGAALQLTCDTLLNAMVRDLSRKSQIGTGRLLQFDTYKMVVVSYLTPCVFHLDLDLSLEFNQRLLETWLAHYPKQRYQLVTEAQISAGFQRKWHQCYITQAVCIYLEKPDDCYELTAFRQFRDGYLRSCSDGSALIEEYYRDAPDIVARIHLNGQSGNIYPWIWKTCLLPCLRDIEGNRLEDCKRNYVAMIRELQAWFLPFRARGSDSI